MSGSTGRRIYIGRWREIYASDRSQFVRPRDTTVDSLSDSWWWRSPDESRSLSQVRFNAKKAREREREKEIASTWSTAFFFFFFSVFLTFSFSLSLSLSLCVSFSLPILPSELTRPSGTCVTTIEHEVRRRVEWTRSVV